nr:FAD-dependent oxidoreductase [uncultured Cohaesibacter sp.]
MRLSIVSLARNSMNYSPQWSRQWRSPSPKDAYDVLIIGGESHGLATAYYLAKEHGYSKIAVLQKDSIGNDGRRSSSTIVRSDFLSDAKTLLHDKSLTLFERLSNELDYNVMFSQRGILSLAHTPRDACYFRRQINANRLNGVEADWVEPFELKSLCPPLNVGLDSYRPILGASLQKRGGIADHDAVIWAYARAADHRGVDIVQECEVTSILQQQGRVTGVETTRGAIKANKVAICVSDGAALLAQKAGLRLPFTPLSIQGLESEPIKPVLHHVVTSNAFGICVYQSDQGKLALDEVGVSSKSSVSHHVFQRAERQASALLELFPTFSRLKLMRTVNRTVDITPDTCPIISKTPVQNLYVNAGWGAGGDDAIAGSGYVFAHTIANDEPHDLNKPFCLERFTTGQHVEEHSAMVCFP